MGYTGEDHEKMFSFLRNLFIKAGFCCCANPSLMRGLFDIDKKIIPDMIIYKKDIEIAIEIGDFKIERACKCNIPILWIDKKDVTKCKFIL